MSLQKTLSSLVLSVLFLSTVPSSTFAQATISCSHIQADDTVAGLGAPVSVICAGNESTVTVNIAAPNGHSYQLDVTTDRSGNGFSLVPAKYTQAAGRYNVSVGSAQDSFEVLADRFSDNASMLSASSTHIDSDGYDSTTITATLYDAFENPVRARPLMLVSTGQDDIQPQSKQTDDYGRISWIVKSSEPGKKTFTAYDVLSGKSLKSRVNISVGNSVSYMPNVYAADLGAGRGGPGSIDHFRIRLAKDGSVKANEYFSITVSALDDQNDVVQDYVGTVIISSSDEGADFPRKGEDPKSPQTGSFSFRPSDLGERLVPLGIRLSSAGPQEITITDKENPQVTGKVTVDVVREGTSGGSNITIVEPKDRSSVGGTKISVSGKSPSFINVKVKKGQDVIATGESDGEGVFRIDDVELGEGATDAILTVESENGTYKSAPILVYVDLTPPVIDAVTVTPELVKEGEMASVQVKSEAGLLSVVADVAEQKIVLTETGSAGMYLATFTAGEAKAYNMKITATDKVGHESQAFKDFTVQRKTLPKVEGVTAEGQANQITVRWKDIDSGAVPVSEYKIYISPDDDPENFVFSLPTGKRVTSAIVKDLTPGKRYRFYLTAIGAEGSESIEKSDPAVAAILGISLSVTPGDQSLTLEWTAPEIPLAKYILDYGIEPGVYAEQRSIAAGAKLHVIKDLINGVTVEVRLTPVDVTGKVLKELAVAGRGTPTSGQSGFRPTPSETVVLNETGSIHSGAPITPPPDFSEVPTNTESGIPPIILWTTLAFAILGGLLVRQHLRSRRLTQQFLAMMEAKYKS